MGCNTSNSDRLFKLNGSNTTIQHIGKREMVDCTRASYRGARTTKFGHRNSLATLMVSPPLILFFVLLRFESFILNGQSN
jgi:hypothetical protein